MRKLLAPVLFLLASAAPAIAQDYDMTSSTQVNWGAGELILVEVFDPAMANQIVAVEYVFTRPRGAQSTGFVFIQLDESGWGVNEVGLGPDGTAVFTYEDIVDTTTIINQ